MPSVADRFESDLKSFKEFVDENGRHYYVMQFDDDSGRVFMKQPSEDGNSTTDLDLRERGAREAMRNIASSTDFEFNEEANTQQNLRNLMEA